MRKIYPKEDVCIGCKLCEVYCLVEHSKSKDLVEAYKKDTPRSKARICVQENGSMSFGLQCRHCEDPRCVKSCITGAMYKDESGVVKVDTEKCVGCWTCIMACQYGSVKQNLEAGRVASKCDLCPSRETPVCVEMCPNEALIYEEEEE